MRIAAINNIYKYNYINNKQPESPSFEARFPNGVKRPRHIKEYIAYINFARYNPLIKNFGTYKIPVHNEEIGRHLRKDYSYSQFLELFNFSKGKGVFDYLMDDKTGFVKTSMINRKENVLMSDMIWITDTCNNLELIKSQHPKDCTKVLEKMADLYEKQKPAFEEVFQNPSKYKKNGVYIWQGQIGVGHCFIPRTLAPHHWFPKTRLESIGNYLQQATDILLTGLNRGKYGYVTAKSIPQKVIDSVVNCTKYLKAINYPHARSCGAWEEQTFASSLTSDTSICNEGLRRVIKLMYKPEEREEIIFLRMRMLDSKNGDVFNDKEKLQSLLKEGEKRIQNCPDIETISPHPRRITPDEMKFYERYYDSAMAFMPQTEKVDPNNIYTDCAKKLYVLKKLGQNLVRDNGAIRYKGDEYLSLDYHTLKDKSRDNKKSNEAEWFLVSEISDAYGTVVEMMLSHIKQKGSISDKDRKLLSIALKGQTEYINRSYARITPKNMTKSNGYSCPAYKVPEAYEAVTLKNGKIKYVPGAHNPLTWAESSLHKASKKFLSNLKKLEEMNISLN